MPEVTVLTAVRNGAKYLPETIESIRKQTFEDWEYIIVDDASTDSTRDIITNYARMDSRIIPVFRETCGGPFVAANHGLKLANGKYIVRTDADDVSLPHRIQRQLEFLSKSPDIKACVSFGRIIDENSSPTDQYFRYPVYPGSLKWFLCLRCPLIHSSTCIENKALLEIGGYQELPSSQDYRFFADLSRRVWLGVVPEDLVLFRQHPQRLSVGKEQEQRRLAYEIIQEHITVVTKTDWTLEDVTALYKAGLGEPFSIRKGLAVLKRWLRHWGEDSRLKDAEKDELHSVYAETKRRFLKKNAKQQPAAFLLHGLDYWAPSFLRRSQRYKSLAKN